MIRFVEGDESMWKGYFYAFLLLLTAMVQTILLSQYFNRMFLVGLRIRTALISAIYRKVLSILNYYYYYYYSIVFNIDAFLLYNHTIGFCL